MKKVILIIFILLLTGCTANYEVNIKNNKITEKLTLIESNSLNFDKKLESGSTIRKLFDSIVNSKDQYAELVYEAKSINTNDTLGIEYNSIKDKQIENLSALSTCYTDSRISTLNGVVTIETGNNFECYEYYELLDSVRVIINIDNEVLESNEDERQGNSYIWNITKNGNKNIKFSYREKLDKGQNRNISIIYIIFIILIVIIMLLYMIKNKNKHNNEI